MFTFAGPLPETASKDNVGGSLTRKNRECKNNPIEGGNHLTTETETVESPAVNIHSVLHQEASLNFPEGGFGWAVVLAASWCNGSVFGIQNSFSILHTMLVRVHEDNDGNSSQFTVAWIGALAMGMIFLCSPLVSMSTDRFGCRLTAAGGGLVAFVGLLTSSFTNSLVLQYITYGLLFGCGSSFTLQPSLVILGHYFHRRLGLANGLVTAGSSLFSVGMPALLEEVVAPLGLSRTFQILSALMLVQVALVSVTFRPRLTSCNHDNEDSMTPSTNQIVGSCCRRFRTRAKQFIGVGVFHVSSFRVWAFSIATAVLGYFVPYVHLMSFVEEQFSEHTGNEWVVLVSIGVSSGIGRLTFGSMGDLIQGVNKIYLQAGSFMLLGLATILMPQCVAFEALVAICGLLGLCDGCFISLMAPVAFTLVGPQRASQAIGYLLGLMALPMTAGPPLAGQTHTNSAQFTTTTVHHDHHVQV
ncbi:monocarboxylate transporter 8-like isoform X2 [Sardina pilchardus]|uniref:monocarboxylate transporter 8-like isoform X2 n=1 Tax=Sardina pilchardus TaxID=27697 RepID=UPI002E116D36